MTDEQQQGRGEGGTDRIKKGERELTEPMSKPTKGTPQTKIPRMLNHVPYIKKTVMTQGKEGKNLKGK